MGEFNLNLSTRPFPAYRVVNVALALFFLVVVGVSVWQVYSFRFYSQYAQSIRKEEQDARAEKVSLGTELDSLTSVLDRPVTTAKLTEIDFLNNLILRKHFSWTEVFSNMESVIPENVHLMNLSPSITKDKVKLEMSVVCRSISDESEFIRRLQASPVFQDVVVEEESKKSAGNSGDVDVKMTVSYFPENAPVASPALPALTTAASKGVSK